MKDLEFFLNNLQYTNSAQDIIYKDSNIYAVFALMAALFPVTA
jgi:hypothetical protein